MTVNRIYIYKYIYSIYIYIAMTLEKMFVFIIRLKSNSYCMSQSLKQSIHKWKQVAMCNGYKCAVFSWISIRCILIYLVYLFSFTILSNRSM